MLMDAFPKKIEKDVTVVLDSISIENDIRNALIKNSPNILWTLENGEKICFPYRIYFEDSISSDEIFSPIQKVIYHCIFSRSYNGYVRYEHIKELLETEAPDWAIPYIIKLCDEYVLGILELVYEKLDGIDTTKYRELCKLNLKQFVRGHNRMISYWNEYHRGKCPNYQDYIGKVLYEQCFGYTKSMDKLSEI